MQLYVGCSGWSYSSWQGSFYPSRLRDSRWLYYYSRVFDYVEIDSSFHRIPAPPMARRWTNTTPDNFRFTAKFPKVITHGKRLENIDRELEDFFHAIAPLYQKTLALLIQLPSSMTITEGMQKLEQVLPKLSPWFRYAVEVRHRSWFQPLAYDFFANNRVCMVWSQLEDIQTPTIVTTDFLYMRFIGDRSIDPKDFGRIQKGRIREMRHWANELKKVQQDEEKKVSFVVASANNHYAGFGPVTANMFRSMMGLPEVTWEARKLASLSDL